jgi:hypothetical protein
MSERIKLVQSDNRPVITLALTDQSDGSPLDLSSAGTIVQVKFRASGTDVVLSTIPCSKSNGGADGVVEFKFAAGELLDIEPGNYEGEIEIDWSGEIQTVYDLLKFKVRADF